jgi:hypothetical protein
MSSAVHRCLERDPNFHLIGLARRSVSAPKGQQDSAQGF